MMRFTWLALGLMVAMLMLVAGAFDEPPSWWRERPAALARMPTVVPAAAPAAAVPVAPGPTNEDHDQLQAQARDLREQIAQERTDLGQVRAAVAAANQDLVALRRQREQASAQALAPASVPERSVAAQTAPEQTLQPTNKSAPVSSTPMAQLATAARPAPAAHADSVAAAHTDLTDGSHTDPGAAAVTSQQRLLATRRLVAARAALAEGKQARARWLLSLARTQMESWPAPRGAEPTAVGDLPETEVETAIALISRDDRDGAVRAIDHLLVAVAGRIPPQPSGQPDPGSASG